MTGTKTSSRENVERGYMYMEQDMEAINALTLVLSGLPTVLKTIILTSIKLANAHRLPPHSTKIVWRFAKSMAQWKKLRPLLLSRNHYHFSGLIGVMTGNEKKEKPGPGRRHLNLPKIVY